MLTTIASNEIIVSPLFDIKMFSCVFETFFCKLIAAQQAQHGPFCLQPKTTAPIRSHNVTLCYNQRVTCFMWPDWICSRRVMTDVLLVIKVSKRDNYYYKPTSNTDVKSTPQAIKTKMEAHKHIRVRAQKGPNILHALSVCMHCKDNATWSAPQMLVINYGIFRNYNIFWVPPCLAFN